MTTSEHLAGHKLYQEIEARYKTEKLRLHDQYCVKR